jgi:uncharacterized protein YdhG (YjbR/CyaY superfamily)
MKTTPAARPAKKSAQAATVDDYVEAAPKDARAALAKLRKTIKAAAPKATEVIGYQIPMYKHHGHLVAFSASGDYCTFTVMSPAVLRQYAVELKGYKLGKASIRFAPSEPLPAALVTKLVKARIAENESGESYQDRL